MSRLSREKREQQGAGAGAGAGAGQPVLAAAPIDVLVGPGGASVGGVPVPVVPGEELQHTVLDHLHRIALATGHPVHATVHDDRIGYVVALRVDTNGASHLTAEPSRTVPPGVPEASVSGESAEGVRGGVPSGVSGQASSPTAPPAPAPAPFPPAPAEPTTPSAPQATASAASAFPPAPPAFPAAPEPDEPVQDSAPPAFPTAPEPAAPPAAAMPSDQPPRDKPTHLLRQTPEPPTFPLRAVPEPDGQEPRDAVPTFRLRAVPEWVADAVPGTVAPPTGQFGPPPVMDAPVTDVPATAPGPESEPKPAAEQYAASDSAPTPSPTRTPTRSYTARPTPTPTPKPFLDPSTAPLDTPDPKPTPPRGFDAVAEAVLGDDPATAYDGGGAVGLAEPMGRINDAVKEGRIEAAAQIAERTVVEASRTLGPEHPEVLRLLELTAYIAYLAGDPARAFALSLDLARSRQHARDAEAAYGNIQSAATAWRAVRDPEQGLRMGVELIGLWTELTMEDGPAVEDIEQLESARTRMGRLAERARKLNS